MRPSLKSEYIPQWRGWDIIVFLVTLEIVSYFFLFLSRETVFPSLPINLLVLVVKVFVYLIILVFCMGRFGRIDLIELVPDRQDALVLIVALLIEFWVFSILVGPEGVGNDRHESIRDLPALQYWVAGSIVVGWIPFLEEALFRRYFLEIQRQHYSTRIAVLITASVAALLHFKFSMARLLWHFLQEAFLSVVYVKSRLSVSVLVHAFINGLVLLLSR